ncbi:MAG: 16S rRNA (uracil(1498)-N(3))-methyltransferase [Polyangiaceae bacterium]|nr:16S rRNA (uracil(1498)-N(3))-methyltransferase [Polyangiaceae bacterium]
MTALVRVPVSDLRSGTTTLDRDTGHYVTRVRRLAASDVFVAFDPQARTEADAEVLDANSRAGVSVAIGALRPASLLPLRPVTLVQCVGKADKLDAVVRDATELGATAILPAHSDRTVAARDSGAALGRYKRIAIEAARQCGRGDVPDIEPPRPLDEIVANTTSTLRLLLHPDVTGDMRALVDEHPRNASVSLVIGPEGGLSAREIAMAEAGGFALVRLGNAVLRTETAATAALGALLVLGR